MTDVAVIIGNPNPGGRTTQVGEAVGAAICGSDGRAVTHELAHVGAHLFEWGNAEVAALTETVAAADVLVVASPTYKATYTGLLKAFLDNYGNNGLAGCKAVPVMVGGDPRHALSVEVHLRPLLVELGASVPTRGLFVLDSRLDELPTTIADWASTAVPLLA